MFRCFRRWYMFWCWLNKERSSDVAAKNFYFCRFCMCAVLVFLCVFDEPWQRVSYIQIALLFYHSYISYCIIVTCCPYVQTVFAVTTFYSHYKSATISKALSWYIKYMTLSCGRQNNIIVKAKFDKIRNYCLLTFILTCNESYTSCFMLICHMIDLKSLCNAYMKVKIVSFSRFLKRYMYNYEIYKIKIFVRCFVFTWK